MFAWNKCDIPDKTANAKNQYVPYSLARRKANPIYILANHKSPANPSKILPILDLIPVSRANCPSTQSNMLAQTNSKIPPML